MEVTHCGMCPFCWVNIDCTLILKKEGEQKSFISHPEKIHPECPLRKKSVIVTLNNSKEETYAEESKQEENQDNSTEGEGQSE